MNYTLAFLDALQQTVLDPNIEGGLVLSHIANDPGKSTFAGISRAFHPEWEGWSLLDKGEPYNSPILAEAMKEFYWRNFWLPISGENLPARIAQLVFDMAINSGPDDANKCLQRAVGVKDDGAIGALTVSAVRNADPKILATRFNAQRCRHIAKTKQSRDSNTGGWWNRMAIQLERGVA